MSPHQIWQSGNVWLVWRQTRQTDGIFLMVYHSFLLQHRVLLPRHDKIPGIKVSFCLPTLYSTFSLSRGPGEGTRRHRRDAGLPLWSKLGDKDPPLLESRYCRHSYIHVLILSPRITCRSDPPQKSKISASRRAHSQTPDAGPRDQEPKQLDKDAKEEVDNAIESRRLHISHAWRTCRLHDPVKIP
jgi:hypothetical protein